MVLLIKNAPANAGDSRDAGSIPELGRYPGGGLGHPLQYSCLENLMDRRAWWSMVHRVANSWTRLKRLSTYSSCNEKNTYIFFTNIIRIHSLCLGENITKMWIQWSGIFTKGWNSDILVSLSLLRVSMLTYYWRGWISQNFPIHVSTSEPLPPTTTIYSKGLPFHCIIWEAWMPAQGLRGSICCRKSIRYHPYRVLKFWRSFKWACMELFTRWL